MKNKCITEYPFLAEWDFEKNGELKPEKVTAGSDRRVWWKCSKCGHGWQARMRHRKNGSGCPACAGRVVVLGKNDLATVHPRLVAEWDFEKNGELKPENVTAGSDRRVWWKCSKCGHRWQARVNSRVYGSGCSKCKRNRLV